MKKRLKICFSLTIDPSVAYDECKSLEGKLNDLSKVESRASDHIRLFLANYLGCKDFVDPNKQQLCMVRGECQDCQDETSEAVKGLCD